MYVLIKAVSSLRVSVFVLPNMCIQESTYGEWDYGDVRVNQLTENGIMGV